MKYMLTIHTDPAGYENASRDDLDAELKGYEALSKELRESGAFVAGEGLQLDTATTVSVKNGERLVTDGPFAETREQLGGFFLLDCKDLDEAISWASKIPGARHGKIEVRPVLNYEA